VVLRLTAEVTERIRAHAAEAYPHECCGALLGRDAEDARGVSELLPLANRHAESPRNRFLIMPDDFRGAEQVARERGLELVGWYHSHPDHPARPSEFDREHAWPWYSYVILSVMRGEPGAMMVWRLADDRGAFHPEPLEVAGMAASVRFCG
jgi:proteasome lid subunit RPN8/RPN11